MNGIAKTAALIIIVLLSGCSTTKDPFEGARWAESDDSFPVLCTKKNRCFQLSKKDKAYFKQQMCLVD